MVFVKNWKFFQILIEKIEIFVKGLTHGFGPKIAIFPTFSFWAIYARKMSFPIF